MTKATNATPSEADTRANFIDPAQTIAVLAALYIIYPFIKDKLP
jgi:hypothetical protein